MRIAILTKNPKLYSHQRLKEAGEKRGHEIHMIDSGHCYMNISSSKPDVHYRNGKLLDSFDAIIPRIGASNTFYGTAILRQFEMMGIYTLNDSMSIVRARDKLRSLQILSRKRIPMPNTAFARSAEDTDSVIELVGGPPIIIKLLEGTQGRGIMLAETYQAAHSVITAFKQLKTNILVQEFIKEAGGSDIRCFVIGDKVVASMERQAKEGEFRSNLHRGGTASSIQITAKERIMAVKAAKAMGLDVAGVDIIRSERGPLVLEINSSPGLEGIETATEKDIAGMMIRYIEKNAKKSSKPEKTSHKS